MPPRALLSMKWPFVDLYIELTPKQIIFGDADIRAALNPSRE
jgi:hypothetical protein